MEVRGVVINDNSRNLPPCSLAYLAPRPIIDYWTSQPTRGQQSHWKYYLNIRNISPRKTKLDKILLVRLQTMTVNKF